MAAVGAVDMSFKSMSSNAQSNISRSILAETHQWFPGQAVASSEMWALETYRDALWHKQHALRSIRKDIVEHTYSTIDALLASMVLLIWLDALESGKDSWMLHLNGMKTLLEHRELPTLEVRGHGEYNSVSSFFPDYFDTVSTMYVTTQKSESLFDTDDIYSLDIMGSTLSRGKTCYSPSDSPHRLLRFLEQSETQTWVGCPAELLYTIWLINSFHSAQADDHNRLLTAIRSTLLTFSPQKWAHKLNQPDLLQPRFHLASAYRSAIAIYAECVVENVTGAVPSVGEFPNSLVDEAIEHLSCVPPHDTHLKGLMWPAFIAGTGAHDAEQKTRVRGIFAKLWDFWRCENVRNAMIVLEGIWAKPSVKGGLSSCLEDFRDQQETWLFI